MAGGRPSKYEAVHCEQVIECLAQGHSVTAFAGEIGVARSTVFKWADEHPEFSDALKTGQARATAFWEKILIGVARDGKGNATAAIFGLKNRAAEDWADRSAGQEQPQTVAPAEPEQSATVSQLADWRRKHANGNGKA